MTIFNKVIEALSGKKTYIVGILTILLGTLNGDMQMVLTGLTALTLRAAVAK